MVVVVLVQAGIRGGAAAAAAATTAVSVSAAATVASDTARLKARDDGNVSIAAVGAVITVYVVGARVLSFRFVVVVRICVGDDNIDVVVVVEMVVMVFISATVIIIVIVVKSSHV